jgi:hypothetical protein
MTAGARWLRDRAANVVTGGIVVPDRRLIRGLPGTALLVIAGLCAAAALAQTTALDLNPGLWQITSTGSMSGAPPIPPETLANMTPEKRAQVQAMMQAAMAHAGEPQIAQRCVTEDQLRRGLNFDERTNPSCHRTMVSTSSTLLVVHEECTGARPMVGDFRFTAVDRETMKGDITVVMGTSANATTVQRSLQGKWLGSDCGDVKPRD